ncbi:MAG TPA: extracellular solute-binding protein [Candidatus Acidoferrales bacterium]|nr:extracellular solute-binding protein [Candidatus Acidoferrales bacterium]
MKGMTGFGLWSLAIWLVSAIGASDLRAASAGLAQAKKQAEAKGFIFETSHADLVAKARQQGGKIRVLSSLDPGLFPHMINGFKQKYPFFDVTMIEITGTDANERFFLEMKAGTVKDFDVVQLAPERYPEYVPYAKKFDIFGMAEHGVLNLSTKMVDPKNRNVVSLATIFFVAVYNKNVLTADKVPDTWDGFLRPEFKGRKMMVDIRPILFATFASCPDQGMGLEWMLNYARQIRVQEPVWVRGFSRTLTAMNAGEYALHSGVYYHSTMRLMQKTPRNNLAIKFIEPVPATLFESEMVLNTSPNPYGGLLFLEYQAGAEGQKIIDEREPLKASIHFPGSVASKQLKGKRVCLNGYDTLQSSSQWEKMALEAFGFPGAELK